MQRLQRDMASKQEVQLTTEETLEEMRKQFQDTSEV